MDLTLPWFTEIKWLFVTFGVFSTLFHFGFLRIKNSIFWKRIDYFWLVMAFVGLVGIVQKNRELMSNRFIETSQTQVFNSYKWLLSSAEFGQSGAICRAFIRTEFSPPKEQIEKTQREFDTQCLWFKDVLSKLKSGKDTEYSNRIVNPSEMMDCPKAGDEWACKSFYERLTDYNNAVLTRDQLQAGSKLSNFEITLQIFAPFLIAIALALRVTKVTWEVKQEKQK